jgi:peptide/nickel transport system substrate-binding protein
MMSFNTGAAPFDDVRARQAVIHALDPSQVALALDASTTDSLLPQGSPLSGVEPKQPGQDKAKAQRLFDELAASGKPLSFTLMGSQSQLPAFEVIKNQLSGYRNVSFTYQVVSGTEWADKLSKRSYQALWGWESGADPDTWLYAITRSGYPDNYLQYKNDDVDAGWTLLRSASTPADRETAYRRILQGLRDNPPWWLLGRLSVTAVMKKGALNGLDGSYADGIAKWDRVSKG